MGGPWCHLQWYASSTLSSKSLPIRQGFDWHTLPKNSIVVDVGGGIGSTSMLLASAFSEGDNDLGLKFIVQDRPVVVEIGERASLLHRSYPHPLIISMQAWEAECPALLENGTVKFQGTYSLFFNLFIEVNLV